MKDIQILERNAPAALTEVAKPNLSERYRHFSTSEIVQTVGGLGYRLVKASQANVRKPERMGFQKHFLRFQNPSLKISDSAVDLLVRNSHDGTGSLLLNLGVYRVACGNGLIVGDEFCQIRIPHRSIEPESVQAGVRGLLDRFPDVVAQIESFRDQEISDREQFEFARRASLLRWKEPLVGAYDLLKSRRPADEGSTLWLVMNRIQENLVRGNVSYRSPDDKIRQTRAVRSPISDFELNKKLWNLGLEFLN